MWICDKLNDFTKKKVLQSESEDGRQLRVGANGTAMAHCLAEQFLPIRFLCTNNENQPRAKSFVNLCYPLTTL
jgi:hypothetical protein